MIHQISTMLNVTLQPFLRMKSPINYTVAIIIITAIIASCAKTDNRQPSADEDVPIAPPEIISTHCTLPRIVAERLPYTDSGFAELTIGVIRTGNEEETSLNTPLDSAENYGETIKDPVEFIAQFPGGPDAWVKFLKDSIHNDVPVNNNAPVGRYTVVVSFMIDTKGNVINVKAETNPGYGTAEEAVRVMQLRPKWETTIQNGRSVVYRQRQAIVFQVDDE